MRFLMFNVGVGSRFNFQLLDSNDTLLLSGATFENRETCVSAIQSLTQALAKSDSYQINALANEVAVTVVDASESVLATSQSFETTDIAQTWIDSTLETAKTVSDYQVTFSTSKVVEKKRTALPALTSIDFASLYIYDYKVTDSKQGLSVFQNSNNSKYYFQVSDTANKATLFSRGFDTAGQRNKRIRQVIDAASIDKRFEIKSDNGQFYFLLKERNGIEIARSGQFGSENEAKSNIKYIQTILPGYDEKYPKAEKSKHKMVNQYDTTLVGTGENGFETMKIEDKGFYFIYNCGGKPILFGQSYTSGSGRDNGIRSVIRNAGDATRYEQKTEGGKHFFILKSSNRQEIAQSAYFATEAEMQEAMACAMKSTSYAGAWEVDLGTAAVTETETFSVAAPVVVEAIVVEAATPASTDGDGDTGRIADDYLNCREYGDHGDADVNDFTRWQHANGEFYFTWHNADGSVKMRSEGYPSTGARDNGMDSVMRNRDNAARYSVTEKMGAFFVVLKAGNHQEIARSCGSADKAALLAMFPVMAIADVAVSAETTTATEISTETVAMAAAPLAVETVAAVAAVIAEPAAIVIEAPAAVVAPPEPVVIVEQDKEDDYMVCEEYKGHSGKDANGITRFKGKDGQFYFTIYDADGKVELRSEGFKTEADLQVEYDMVVKYQNDESRYNVIEKNGYTMKVLKTPEGREIGRSCVEKIVVAAPVVEVPKVAVAAAVVAAAATIAHVIPEPKVEVEIPKPKIDIKKAEVVVEAPTPPVVPVVAAVAATVAAAAVVNNVIKDKEDEYMVCEEYKGHSGKDANGITKFKGADGQYYFTIYDDNGKVQLRSEGFKTEADLKVEYDMVVKYRNDKNRYTVVEKNGYTMRILKTPEGREIGRSCLEKIVVAAAVPPIVPPVAAPLAAEVAAGGFKWWYLLPLLLLPLLWFLCNKPAAKLPAVTPPVVVAPTPVPAPAPAKPAAVESCDLHWIFFDFDKSDLRAASKAELDQLAVILKDHKDYVGLLSAHTDSKGSDAYNIALSERRAKAARAYMATKGLDGARIKSEMSGEKDSFADNDEEDVKRQYNRRVELRVMDASGKEVCKSIAPDLK